MKYSEKGFNKISILSCVRRSSQELLLENLIVGYVEVNIYAYLAVCVLSRKSAS
jgi:hypothetical protein